MEHNEELKIRKKLIDRQNRLNETINDTGKSEYLLELLQQVDAALDRMDRGTYGICETCHDPIEEERLLIDPLTCFCLDHLTQNQQKELEQDFYLASRIQGALLPKRDHQIGPWQIYYSYLPAGPVSGDYCDLVKLNKDEETFAFFLGDVSGKGVAASMLMTHLHAMFHSLIDLNLPPDNLIDKVNRLFCESTLSTHYTTLIGGYADKQGEIEIVNAGHWPALLIKKDKFEWIGTTGLPLGFFCNGNYTTRKLKLEKNDTLLLYTDGLIEAGYQREENGESRVETGIPVVRNLNAEATVNYYLEDLRKFLKGSAQSDDLTIMAIKRDA